MSDTGSIYSGSPDLDTMGGRLSRARDAIELSTAQLARRLGVQTATIQAWESDRSQPRANRLSMLAGVLNVSPSWLLYGVGTAPVEDTRSEMARTLEAQLERLKRLHEESAEIIGQIEIDLRRYATDR
jgi:HTH-type transcriptional regulator, cell division transcriptional repressor